MKFPTYKEMGEKIAEQALDEYVINGKTLREWIKLLSEQEPCTDSVSRQAVYEILEGNWNTDFLHAEVEKLPSVQPKAKTGIWEFAYRFHRKCSVCGEVVNISEDDNYCHKCGAKMEREPNDHLSQF